MLEYCYLDIETLGLDPFKNKLVGFGIFKPPQYEYAVKRDEHELIGNFNGVLGNFKITPQDAILVTFNGDYFDVPFLVSRGLKYSRSLPLYAMRHLDLMWVIKKYLRKGGLKFTSLKELAEFLEIPCDDEISGAEVPQLYAEGKLEEIERHMRSDVDLLMKAHYKLKDLCDFDLKVRYRIGPPLIFHRIQEVSSD